MKKILHITNRLSEGGVDTFLTEFLPALSNCNYLVSLLVLDSEEISKRFIDVLLENNVNVYTSKYKNIYNPLHVFEIAKYIDSHDIVHSHLFPTQYYTAIASLFFFKRRTKFVTSEHCNTNKRRQIYLFKFLDKLVYRSYQKVICVSEASKVNLDNWIDNPSISISINNGTKLERIYDANPANRDKYGIAPDTFLIVMTARFFSQKNHQCLVKSLQFLPESVHIAFVGSGELLDEVKTLTDNLKLKDRVKFLGHIMDVPSIIKMADICVLSSHFEGLPISIIEYMAAGKPVVATNIDGIKEIIPTKICLYEYNNHQDLSAKIKMLLDDSQFRFDIGNENFINSKKYNFSSMLEKYLQIYETI